MWRFGTGLCCFSTMLFIFNVLQGMNHAYSLPRDLDSLEYKHLNHWLRDALNYLDSAHRSSGRRISGQVNLRTQRSELMGDMAQALGLYQLQELDRQYGTRARPRFGKRSEVVQENMNPMYDYQQKKYGDMDEQQGWGSSR